MTKISVVIITYNEERNIGRCLDSVRDIADDIVVVDSYSTDGTEKICREYGVRFIQHAFEGHIEQKNWAINQAKYPHILSLDADELLSEELRRSILEVKENWKYDGYYFNRLTNYCGKWIRHTSWYPARKLRLWDSRKGRWGGLNPHDRFILFKGASKKYLPGDLLHYSYFSINEHIEQINKFSSIVSRAYYKAGKRATILNIIFSPIWRMFRDYFIKLGFLDGYYGLVISVNSAHETFLKYIKLRDYCRTQTAVGVDRLCFINSVKSWGGGEKWHFDVASRLSRNGYNTFLIIDPRSELYHRVQESPLRVYRIAISNLSFLNPIKILRLRKIFREENVKTAIINLSSDLKAGGIAAKLAGVKNIIYRRGSAIPIRNTPLNRYLFRHVVTRVIANSEETKRTIVQRNHKLYDLNKIEVIYNGINLKEYDRAQKHILFQRKDSEIIIGNAGRLVKQKGHRLLINVAEILRDRGLKFRILIAGKGKLETELRQLVKRKGLEDHIEFLGFVKDMQGFMNSLDLFVLSSLWEGFGYVIIEAMVCHKPVIGFDLSSNPEMIVDGYNGYLIEPYDVHAFADKIIKIARYPKLRTRLGDNARRIVEDKFTIDRAIEEVDNMLQTMH